VVRRGRLRRDDLPGSDAPTYVCIGDRTGRCPLVEDADVIVLDCRIESHDVHEGTSAYDLLSLYVTSEKPVIVLGGSDIAHRFIEEEAVFLEQDPDGGLIAAVERILAD
jgi:hypothetical protein